MPPLKPLDRFQSFWSLRVLPVLKTGTLWKGIGLLAAVWIATYYIVDRWVMPTYTRHGVHVSVPDLRALSLDEATENLEEHALRLAPLLRRYDPEQPRDIILNQDPAPETLVKPGRRIYLTINSGEVSRIVVPDLQFVSMREAKSRLASQRLLLGEVLEDTLPAPFRNTVIRQDPAPGDSVAPGSLVTVWISSGLGDTFVPVPDITGLSVRDAEHLLARSSLRLVVLQDPRIPVARMDTIVRQQPPADFEVRSGSEIRGFAHMSEAPVELIEADSLQW